MTTMIDACSAAAGAWRCTGLRTGRRSANGSPLFFGGDPFRDAESAAILQNPSKMSGVLYGGAAWSTQRTPTRPVCAAAVDESAFL